MALLFRLMLWEMDDFPGCELLLYPYSVLNPELLPSHGLKTR